MPNLLQEIFGWYGLIGLILSTVFIFGCVIVKRSIKSFFSALLFFPLIIAFWPLVVYEWVTGKHILLK
ncbi:hypothetical protein HZB94_02225 [Candidatus Falkowbacteria bacterium]|nr:hypothetical protein [Candidatus Falkowbacteria bacterium]